MATEAEAGPLSPWGVPLGEARLRCEPEDFVVRELPLVEPSGSGEHVLVRLRKRGWTTAAAAGALARVFDVPKARVSYAGMKDRHALTEQWLSIHAPGQDITPLVALPDGLAILECHRHARKLRRGALRGNRFELRLRGVSAQAYALDERLVAIAHRGVPNYFGSQRFGRDGDNADRARAWFRGDRRVRDRGERSILLSAARSAVFNAVLAARVEDGTWDRAVAGDRLMLDGRQSLFSAASEKEARLRARLAAGSIHPTGPLPGRAANLPGDESLPAIESRITDANHDLVTGLAATGVVADRRALRVRVARLSWYWDGAGSLVVGFDLPAGAYATTVLGQALRLHEPSVS